MDYAWQIKVAFILALATSLSVCGVILAYADHQDINELQKRIECLEHPHAESSISATKINGKWIVSTPHRTGC